MHGGPHSAAHIHPTLDEETRKAGEEAGGGGGMGGGDIQRVVCDAVELSQEQRAARGAVRGAVGRQRRTTERGEDPELAASPSLRRSHLCLLFHCCETSEGSSAEEHATHTR